MAMKEAMLYEKLSGGQVRCRLCAHYCVIGDGRQGLCHVRENRRGILYTHTYGETIAQCVDPIEKKPLFHFEPGSLAYSVATLGCNFRCRWCQNWPLSQPARSRKPPDREKASPEQIVDSARQSRCRSIAYTYTEPTIFFEYAYDTARLGHEAGMANIFVTNGYLSYEALTLFGPYLDAANVDLKAFRDETYERYVGGRLQPVLDTLKIMKRRGIWLEVTTLVVPGINDDTAELKDLAAFIASELGIDTPWHISRFFPAHRMTDTPPTHTAVLRQARDIGREAGLRYVYVGNMSDEENTCCHECGAMLIRRNDYRIVEEHLNSDGRCPDCGTLIPGLWTEEALAT
jgi:pyruvate formate lyase activating enzyme